MSQQRYVPISIGFLKCALIRNIAVPWKDRETSILTLAWMDHIKVYRIGGLGWSQKRPTTRKPLCISYWQQMTLTHNFDKGPQKDYQSHLHTERQNWAAHHCFPYLPPWVLLNPQQKSSKNWASALHASSTWISRHVKNHLKRTDSIQGIQPLPCFTTSHTTTYSWALGQDGPDIMKLLNKLCIRMADFKLIYCQRALLDAILENSGKPDSISLWPILQGVQVLDPSILRSTTNFAQEIALWLTKLEEELNMRSGRRLKIFILFCSELTA